MKRVPYPPVVWAGLVLLVLLLSQALMRGAVELSAESVWLMLADVIAGRASAYSGSTVEHIVLMELRIPRALLAMMVGAVLAQCGAVMQGLFRNPLAEPGLIGVSSGAAVGAIVVIVLLPAAWSDWAVPLGAFASGLLCTLVVYRLAHSESGTSVVLLLLAGVAVAAISGAVIGFLTYFTNDQQLRELSLWQMGTFSSARWSKVIWIAPVFVMLSLVYFRFSEQMDALLLGEAQARYLGVEVEHLKIALILLCAFGVGACVAFSGVIGFVGLIVPQAVRLLVGPSHRRVLPLSALLGAALMLSADLASRLIIQPAELPVGILTALLGGPFFILLLIKQRRSWSP